VQGEGDGLLGAQKAGANREIDVKAGELRAEGAGLRPPACGQRDRLGRAALAADSACRAKTNKRSRSAGIAGLLLMVPRASGSHLGPVDGARQRARLGMRPKLAAIAVSGCHLILVICDVALVIPP
jgi:hypothetical protein